MRIRENASGAWNHDRREYRLANRNAIRNTSNGSSYHQNIHILSDLQCMMNCNVDRFGS
jgi:hypothetical protein